MNGSADYPDPLPSDLSTPPSPSREEELTAALARSQADFANYKRRTEAQLAANSHTVLAEHMRSLLPILDDVDRANQHEDLSEGSLKVLSRFLVAFESLGLTKVVAVGVEFDPNFHEALSQEPSTEVEVDTVGSIYQDGYFFGDTLLRPARVHVLVAS